MGQSKEKRTLLTNEQIRQLIDAARTKDCVGSFDSHEEAAQRGYITARHIKDARWLSTSQARFLRRTMADMHAESAIIVCGVKCKAVNVNGLTAE